MQLQSIDLNLLVVLHALLEERSVVRAGRRLALSPSATSHALSRLREVLADDLLVRAGRRLVPTPRAEALGPAVRQLIANVEGVLRPPTRAEPRAFTRTFRIAATDHVQFVLLRPLDALLRREAPDVDLCFLNLAVGSSEMLRDGGADVAISLVDTSPPDLNRQPLFEDGFVSVVRSGHAALAGRLASHRFGQFNHVVVTPTGTPGVLVEQQIAALGLGGRVARTLPTFLDAPFLVAHSDYIVSLPARLVQPLFGLLNLRLLRQAPPTATFALSAMWHRRFDGDPEHQWLRDVLARVARELEPLDVVLRRLSTRRRADCGR